MLASFPKKPYLKYKFLLTICKCCFSPRFTFPFQASVARGGGGGDDGGDDDDKLSWHKFAFLFGIFFAVRYKIYLKKFLDAR